MISDIYYLIKATSKYIVNSPDYDKDVYNALMRVKTERPVNEPFVKGIVFEFNRLTDKHIFTDMLAEKAIDHIGRIIKCKRKKKITSNKYFLLRRFLFNNMIESNQFLNDMSPADLSYYIEKLKIMDYPEFIKRHIDNLCQSINSELLQFSFEKAFSLQEQKIDNELKKELFLNIYRLAGTEKNISKNTINFLCNYIEVLDKYIEKDHIIFESDLRQGEYDFYFDSQTPTDSGIILDAELKRDMYGHNVEAINSALSIHYEKIVLNNMATKNNSVIKSMSKARI